jgi:hypothetical protein
MIMGLNPESRFSFLFFWKGTDALILFVRDISNVLARSEAAMGRWGYNRHGKNKKIR